MKFKKAGEWKVSDCGFYRIQPVGWQRGRSSTFRLQVQLVDGWIDYPEAFSRMKDAAAVAISLEND